RKLKVAELSSRRHLFGLIGGVRLRMEVFKNETKRRELVNNLQSLSAGDRVRMLRAMPLSLAEKTKLRKLAFSDKVGQSLLISQVPCSSLLKRGSFVSRLVRRSLHPKFPAVVEGGSEEVVWPLRHWPSTRPFTPPAPTESQAWSCSPAQVISLTLMFYGYYTNSTINTSCRPDDATTGTVCGTTSDPQRMAYNIPLAYFFTIGISFFITGIVLVYSMSKSFGRSFCVFKSQGNLAIKVFCSWDFKVSKKTSVRLQSENISTQLKELLSEVNCREEEKGRLAGMRCTC
ncbi:hypothetical protein J4Q44_G00392440, partial [Coregonus suidteri]